MSQPPTSPYSAEGPHGHDGPANPRSDFIAALCWMALGTAILIGSWTMDRLESQDVNPYTVPGLLPGLLGIAIVLLGGGLLWRSCRQGALRVWRIPAALPDPGAARQLWLALGLCVAFDAGLVGHGLPFWLAAAIFVTAAILTLQHAQRKAAGRRLSLRAVLVAASIGLGAGGAITLVFQQIFLVRLP